MTGLAKVQERDRRWSDLAACRGIATDLFFPKRGESTAEAVAVCDRCEVKGECLEWALDSGQRYGIWGGTSERERRRIRLERRRRLSKETAA